MKKESTENKKYYFAIGRRKTAKALVMLFEGQGEVIINGKKLEEYFPLSADRNLLLSPLKDIDSVTKFYFTVKTIGGGSKAARDAIRLGLARALVKYDIDLKKVLKQKGHMSRDSRMVERKHTGFVKARKKPQYSKR